MKRHFLQVRRQCGGISRECRGVEPAAKTKKNNSDDETPHADLKTPNTAQKYSSTVKYGEQSKYNNNCSYGQPNSDNQQLHRIRDSLSRRQQYGTSRGHHNNEDQKKKNIYICGKVKISATKYFVYSSTVHAVSSFFV